MNTNLEPPDSRNHPPPDLTEALIIILISAAILIFVFWISTQFVGQDRFSVLPNYIVAVFKNIWSSIVTGAAGIGLAILNAFNKRGQPHPNYLKYIAFTVLALFIPIAAIVTFAVVSKLSLPVAQQPPNTTTIDVNGAGKTEFDLENSPLSGPLRYVLRGSFTVSNGVLSGHLNKGEITVSNSLPEMFPRAINRISFRACYNDPATPQQLRNIFPPYAKARDSIDVNFPLKPGATYSVPDADFAFDLPDAKHVSKAWLCGALWTEISFFPAE